MTTALTIIESIAFFGFVWHFVVKAGIDLYRDCKE